MKPNIRPITLVCFSLLLVTFTIGTSVARAQNTSGPDDDFIVRDGNAGYIDLAIPGNQIRMIFDSGYGLNRPTRNEYFYARRGPQGPGLPLPETNIDYQDASIYMEQLVMDDVSAFIQVGSRSINPEINDNSTGLSDMTLGVKAALVSTPDMVLSGQLKVSIPTGDATRGLGTNNVSIEPGLLLFAPVDDKLAVLGELRYWMPVDGTSFAGPVLRYGIGTQYELYDSQSTKIVPVIELVGWTT
ncbi:MAG: transporter, partial [Planctomycetaceae bacterium]|nr:transporter [Planctomycetaceae bacterium]